jgi:RNA polymerase sigma-70 factor (ECF subfamily)
MTDKNPELGRPEREYLLLLGRMQLSARLEGKVDLSGVVQQTLWEAEKACPPDAQRLPWLRKLLANNLRDEIRKLTAKRRDVRREASIEASIEESSSRLETWLAQKGSSASQHLIRSEELGRLACALSELPADQRMAIELHHLHGQPLAEVAEQLGRTKEATAALLYRALKRLRKRLDAAGGE